MWLVLRILTVVGVYLWKFLWRQQSIDETAPFRDTQRVKKLVTNKRSFVKIFRGLGYTGPLRFQITEEGWGDSFFKNLGLAVEQQTGDGQFDEDYYLTCDQPMLGEVLRDHPAARRAVDRVFRCGAKRIFSDGANVWADIREEEHDENEVWDALHELRAALLKADPTHERSRLDAFFWKAVGVESLVWSIAGYGVPGFIELTWNRSTIYPDATPIFKAGLLWSVGVLAGLFGVIVLLLRGSSRGHRILAESFLVLLVGVPLAMVQTASDVNIHLDTSAPLLVESRVAHKNTEVRRRRRGGSTTHYYLQLAATGPHRHLPLDRTEVERSLYDAVAKNSLMIVTLRAGRLNCPWIESIHPKR